MRKKLNKKLYNIFNYKVLIVILSIISIVILASKNSSILNSNASVDKKKDAIVLKLTVSPDNKVLNYTYSDVSLEYIDRSLKTKSDRTSQVKYQLTDTTNNTNITPINVYPQITIIETFDKNKKISSKSQKNEQNMILEFKLSSKDIDNLNFNNIPLKDIKGLESSKVNVSNISSTNLYINNGNRNHDNTFDIAIVGAGYGDREVSTFNQKAQEVKNNILSGPFFRDNQDKINIIQVNTMYSFADLGCRSEGNYDCANLNDITSIGAAVNADNTIVIANNPSYSGVAFIGRDVISLNNYSTSVVVHELGHTLGWLWDEYVYDNLSGVALQDGGNTLVGTNCQTSCSKFDKKYVPNGCFLGCNFGLNAYRTTEDSLMRNSYQDINLIGYDNMKKRMILYAPKVSDGWIARLLSPKYNEEVFAGKINFAWDKGENINKYKVTVSSVKGANDIKCSYEGTNTSFTCDVPSNLSKIYIRVASQIDSSWPYNDYEFLMGTATGEIISPAKGADLFFPATFVFKPGSNISSYVLKIGSNNKLDNVYSKNIGIGSTYIMQYQDLNDTNGRPNDLTPIKVTLATIYKSGYAQNATPVNYRLRIDSIGLPLEIKCNRTSLESQINKLAPKLKVGSTYSYNQIINMMSVAKINTPAKNLNYNRVSSESLWAKVNKSSGGLCALVFDIPQNDKYIYKGIQLVDTLLNDNSPATFVKSKSTNYGLGIIVVEQNQSLTPYQTKF